MFFLESGVLIFSGETERRNSEHKSNQRIVISFFSLLPRVLGHSVLDSKQINDNRKFREEIVLRSHSIIGRTRATVNSHNHIYLCAHIQVYLT